MAIKTESILDFFRRPSPNATLAKHLRVNVVRNNELVADITMPARCAQWLDEVIPQDVIEKIKAEGIALEELQKNFAKPEQLKPQEVFTLNTPERNVRVWLE